MDAVDVFAPYSGYLHASDLGQYQLLQHRLIVHSRSRRFTDCVFFEITSGQFRYVWRGAVIVSIPPLLTLHALKGALADVASQVGDDVLDLFVAHLFVKGYHIFGQADGSAAFLYNLEEVIVRFRRHEFGI